MGVALADLVIPNGTKPSNVISGRILRTVKSISITAPATLTGTISIQIPDGIGTSPTFTNLQSPPGTDITIALSKSIVITSMPMHGIRVNSGSNEGAERTFKVFGEERSHQ